MKLGAGRVYIPTPVTHLQTNSAGTLMASQVQAVSKLMMQ